MFKLRYYQTEAIDATYQYFRTHPVGNPIIVLPTGAGKSPTIAGLIHRLFSSYPDIRIVVLTHVKELVEQDASAIVRYWPEVPIGIWSAGVGLKQKAQVTVAGIQSIHTHPALFSPVDIVLIDECQLLPESGETMYRRFLEALKRYNPAMKVIGFTATPYRLKSGLLIEGKNRLFTDIAYSINVADLIAQGYLARLVSKAGQVRADLSNLHRRGGEFIPAELADRMDKVHLIRGAVEEMIAYGKDRKAWLVFCSGVAHAQHVADCLNHYGIPTGMICGDTPKRERAKLIADFKSGKLRALTNSDVLTTGFDHPQIDLIAMLRPTDSVGLYMQILGRGLRPVYAPGFDLETIEGRLDALANGSKKDCLVLDFAGNVERHGPIDLIKVKSKRAPGEDAVSVAPAKECPSCHALIYASIMTCPECGHVFPAQAKHDAVASEAALLASQRVPKVWQVTKARYTRHVKAGRSSLCVTYECGNLRTFTEYLPIESQDQWAQKLAVKWFWMRGMVAPKTVSEALEMTIPTPETITVIPDGKYNKITGYSFATA